MSELEKFDPYTSYRLHWFPYEITRCRRLKDSTVSTRAIYGNFKYRPPFPKLPDLIPEQIPATCSVCDQSLETGDVHQAWISLGVATDVLPLLVHACSSDCLENLPKGPRGYSEGFHQGGLDLIQPPVESSMSESRIREYLEKALAETTTDSIQAELTWVAELAIESGLAKSLDEIVGAGLDVSKTSGPLISALSLHDLDTAKRLIRLGSPIDAQCDGETPLMAAASEGYFDGVQLLLENGANAFHREGESGLNVIELIQAAIKDLSLIHI